MNIAPASALATWAIGTAWLLLFFFFEHLDRIVGEDLIDLIRAVSFVLMLPFYPILRRRFSAWLVRAKDSSARK
jgi:hypothetical protein